MTGKEGGIKISVDDIHVAKQKFIYENLLISKAGVAELLNCTGRTVERMVVAGDLVPYRKYSDRGKVGFLASDVGRYVQSIKVVNNYE